MRDEAQIDGAIMKIAYLVSKDLFPDLDFDELTHEQLEKLKETVEHLVKLWFLKKINPYTLFTGE